LHESCCVIVGAGPGLGLNVARRFAQGGFDIALISRDQSKLDGLSETLNSEGYTAQGFAADAAIEQELQSAFSRITQWNGDIGALVYNASAMIPDNVLDMTPSSMMDKMAPNLGGAICSVNQVLPLMRGRGGGTILITGGGLGLEPYPNWASLSAGKAALRNYTLALHKALSPEEIHVAVIAVCGIVEAGGAFDPDRIAEEYWQLHAESKPNWRRELIYLPQGADPYYNDAVGAYRSTSLPVGLKSKIGS
jgi:short-subunit dehydrogenase